MKAFPPAQAGQVRHVLQLPQQKDEGGFKQVKDRASHASPCVPNGALAGLFSEKEDENIGYLLMEFTEAIRDKFAQLLPTL